jgi:hypothetical protein
VSISILRHGFLRRNLSICCPNPAQTGPNCTQNRTNQHRLQPTNLHRASLHPTAAALLLFAEGPGLKPPEFIDFIQGAEAPCSLRKTGNDKATTKTPGLRSETWGTRNDRDSGCARMTNKNKQRQGQPQRFQIRQNDDFKRLRQYDGLEVEFFVTCEAENRGRWISNRTICV